MKWKEEKRNVWCRGNRKIIVKFHDRQTRKKPFRSNCVWARVSVCNFRHAIFSWYSQSGCVMNACTSKCNFRTETANMVTTIKITCDGVFIQTNSNRIRATDERIVTDSSINVINGTNRGNHHHRNHSHSHSLHQQRHRLGSHHAIVDSPNKAPFNGITKRSISVHNIDSAPQSLPNLPIANDPPALLSPQLVKTLSRIKKTTTTTTAEAEATETDASPNKVLINSLSMSTDALSSLSAARSIHRVIRVDRNGKSVQRATPITSCTRQWDGGTVANKMKNGTVHNTSAVVRRRNTFKSYLIECKENIVRRLSSPTPLIG